MKRNHPTYISHFGSAIGGLAGAAMAGFIAPTPESMLVGGAAGNFIVGSLSYGIADRMFLKDSSSSPISVSTMIDYKLLKDFRLSLIHDNSKFYYSETQTLQRIKRMANFRDDSMLKLISESGPLWLRKNFRGVHQLIDEYPHCIPFELRKATEELNNHFRDDGGLRISAECIEPACVAVLRSLSNKKRFGLNLEIDYQDTSGVYQVKNVHDRKNYYDFICTADGAFFLYTDSINCKSSYLKTFSIHGEEQIILRRKRIGRKNHNRIHVFNHSSAEEQFLVRSESLNKFEKIPHGSFERFSHIVKNLDNDELILAWEPLASLLSSKHWVRQFGPKYVNHISMYNQKKYDSRLKVIKDKFLRLFVYEWIYCMKNFQWASDQLKDDEQFSEKFAQGCGLTSDYSNLIYSSE